MGGEAVKVKMHGSEEKKANRNMVMQNDGKERYKKKCAARAKLFVC